MKRFILLSGFCFFIFSPFLPGASLAAPRTVMVQLFEWPWADVGRECENLLGPKGFSAVQVSPPHEHLSRAEANWWERYQVVSYQIKSRSGDEKAFKDMVDRCHKAGVGIYADVIINHMAGFIDGKGFAGTPFTHFAYPNLYSPSDFHHCGRNGNDIIKNYNDRYELQNCALVDLADLATESDYVRTTLAGYMNHLLDLGVDGFRLDAAKHIPATDIRQILNKLKRSTYIYQELILGNTDVVKYDEYYPNGDVLSQSYPYQIGKAFRENQAGSLSGLAQGQPPTDRVVVAIENHDIQRSQPQTDLVSFQREPALYRLAQTFLLTWPYGYPSLFTGYSFSDFDKGPPVDESLKTLTVFDQQGQCQKPWLCAHRLPEVAALVDFRNQTNNAFSATDLWTNGTNMIAFGRASQGFVVINYATTELNQRLKTSLPAGSYCNLMSSEYEVRSRSCKQGFNVDAQGFLKLRLNAMSSLVLLQQAKVK